MIVSNLKIEEILENDFLENRKRSKLKLDAYVSFLSKLSQNYVFREEFDEFIRTNTIDTKRFLFELSKIAFLNFSFETFCKIVKWFSTWNCSFKKRFRTEQFFVYAITTKRKSVKIRTPEEFREKLNLMNGVGGLRITTYLDVLDFASDLFTQDKISYDKYLVVVYLVLKCSKQFQNTINRRVYMALMEKKMYSKALQFFY